MSWDKYAYTPTYTLSSLLPVYFLSFTVDIDIEYHNVRVVPYCQTFYALRCELQFHYTVFSRQQSPGIFSRPNKNITIIEIQERFRQIKFSVLVFII